MSSGGATGASAAKARRAVEEHRAAVNELRELSAERRAALNALRDAGLTWREVATAVGLSPKAAVRAAGDPARTRGRWWVAIPDDVSLGYKRGPGGVPRAQVVTRDILDPVVVEAVTSLATATGHGVQLRDVIDMAGHVLGRPVPRVSVQVSVRRAVENGTIRRVRTGYYIPVTE